MHLKNFLGVTEAQWHRHIGMSSASYTQSLADRGSKSGKEDSNL